MSVPGETSPAAASDVSEQEIQVRLETITVGIWLTVIVVLGSQAYVWATWDGPHREVITLIGIAALFSSLAIYLAPMEKVVRSRFRELFFVCWTISDILMIATIVAFDGGTRSPYALLFVLPFLFGSLSYPLRLTTLIGAIDIAAFLLVALTVGGGLIYSAFGGFALLCAALLSSWEAQNQGKRRAELSETASALKQSEETSRLAARQQMEVARFGQLALEGAGVQELRDEVTQVMDRVLGVDIAGVLKLLPGGRELLLVSAAGLSQESIGKTTVPTGYESQSGYALATGLPTVVRDWRSETRFKESKLQADAGMRSAAIILIKGKGDPYGVIGVASRTLREFTSQDVNFMQAIANVLANAIERRTAEDRVQHEALHDPLTGLPNRNLFLDRLKHALAQASRRGTALAVLFLDLDQFKRVNDSLGHAAGDELLASVAPRLEQALRPGDTVARFGGDEFAILAEDIGDERGATRIAERLAEGLTRPFVVRQREHFVSASTGISIGSGGEAPEALIRDADAALYRAKDRGRGGYEIFDEVMRSRVIEQMQTENDLRRALQRGELELHYQPVIALRDSSIVLLEALLRWNHPDRGLIWPAAFIPVAEESRLIVPIGRWVIEEACHKAAEWQQRAPDSAPVGIAVNLSARQLTDPDLIPSVARALEVSGIEAATLRLELTESILLEDNETIEHTLQGLRGLGVKLVLDDFGIGFSSLGYLKRLPLDAVKLDRSFVENLADASVDAAIVRAVTEMTTALGIGVVAEGVETVEQLRAVQQLGCGYAQGFYFTQPVPAGEVEGLMARPMRAVSP
jgi:diguanylate cyclase (GGDEF)-like protein